MADHEKSKNHILQALVALSHAHTLYHARAAARRSTPLALPRSADRDDDAAGADAVPAEAPRSLSCSRRLSLMLPFRSRSKQDKHGKDDNTDDSEDDDDTDDGDAALLKRQSFAGMQRVGCLFSVEVVAAQGLPSSLNGLLLAVAVRPKETRDGALQTMPARVQKGAANFDETLYVRCHLYCSGGGTGKPLKFEPRPFLLSVVAVDTPELDLGQRSMDFSAFVKEFTDKCQQGLWPRQWDATFPLAGKAKGGDLVVKLAFQIMEGLGLVVNSQPDAAWEATNSSWSSSFARKISKSSFIIMSPMMLTSKQSFPPKMGVSMPESKDIDNFKLDEPAPAAEVKVMVAEQKELEHKPEEVKVEQLKEMAEPKPVVVKEEEEKPEHELEPEETKEEGEQKESEPKTEEKDKKSDDSDMPEFDVVDKGIEGQGEAEAEKALEATELGVVSDTASVSKLEPETEDEKSVDLELPEFDMVDKGIEAQDEAEAKKALEAMMLGALSDAATESVEQPETNKEEVTGESQQSPEAKEEVTGESQQSPEANKEEVTGESLQSSEANGEEVTGEQPAEANGEQVTEDSLQPSKASRKEVTGESLQPPEDNVEEVTGESLQSPEAIREELTGEYLQLPKANGEELTGESLQPSKTNREEVTEESLQPPDANREEVTGESL